MTRWDREAGRLDLQLPAVGVTFTAAVMTPQGPQPDPAAFDAAAQALKAEAPAPLLLMDELGYLEACSPLFQRTVFQLLDAATPVLGVLRHHPRSPFWGPVSSRPDVYRLPLTLDNRDELPARIHQLLGL